MDHPIPNNIATLQHCNIATLQHCNCSTFQLCYIVTLLFCNIATLQVCQTDQLDGSAGRTSWTDQLDGQAGRTSWTDQLHGPAGRPSWTDQFDRQAGRTSQTDQVGGSVLFFEALASLHIQRLTFPFVHCRSFQVQQKPCFTSLGQFPGSKISQIHTLHISASFTSMPVEIPWACTRHVVT